MSSHEEKLINYKDRYENLIAEIVKLHRSLRSLEDICGSEGEKDIADEAMRLHGKLENAIKILEK